jgi:alkylhydroperoxidase/carboxymuconolactone decarboxylase family protein YurZ
MNYHDSKDLKQLGELKRLAPTEFSAFVELDKTVGRDGGAIPRKYRELIAHCGGLHNSVPLLP